MTRARAANGTGTLQVVVSLSHMGPSLKPFNLKCASGYFKCLLQIPVHTDAGQAGGYGATGGCTASGTP